MVSPSKPSLIDPVESPDEIPVKRIALIALAVLVVVLSALNISILSKLQRVMENDLAFADQVAAGASTTAALLKQHKVSIETVSSSTQMTDAQRQIQIEALGNLFALNATPIIRVQTYNHFGAADGCRSADGANACELRMKGEAVCASTDLPFGTKLQILGLGVCTVRDRIDKTKAENGVLGVYVGDDGKELKPASSAYFVREVK